MTPQAPLQNSGAAPFVRPATSADRDAIWQIIEPTFRAGETYAVARDISREDALAFWFAPGHEVFAAEAEGQAEPLLGTYFLRGYASEVLQKRIRHKSG